MKPFERPLTRGQERPPRRDLRCHNLECDLFELRLEADEVSGSKPSRCASCGGRLRSYREDKE